ncbi:MAG: DUF2384 domain-containing protein [Acidobacteria bacterium]|nr:DUF2384 domain-containing protein [Acidobacteriota bacterium]
MAEKRSTHKVHRGQTQYFRTSSAAQSSIAHPLVPKRAANSLFEQMATGSSIPADQLRQMIIPRASWKRAGQKLTASASQAALRVERVFNLAKSIWGDASIAAQWLNRPHEELSGATPLSFLKTESGGRCVEELLIALEHGFPV